MRLLFVLAVALLVDCGTPPIPPPDDSSAPMLDLTAPVDMKTTPFDCGLPCSPHD